ncbi:MAG: phasin family protein [Alphaproteobacteria bacterium]
MTSSKRKPAGKLNGAKSVSTAAKPPVRNPATEIAPMTKEQLESVAGDALKTYGDLAAMGKANVETTLKATAVLSKGVEEIGQAWAALAKRLVDIQMSSLQTLLGARNIKDVVEVHADLTKNHFQTAMSEGAKISELTLKVANEAIQPLSARVTDTVKATAKAA